MKPIITDISEMTDSREMYESRTSKVGVAFIYTILALLVVAVLWMCIGKIDVCVKADGMLKPSDSVNTVVNIREGFVEKVYYKPSDTVSKGDILYIIDHTDLLTRKDYYMEQIALNEEEVTTLTAYADAVDGGKDTLGVTDAVGISLRYKTQYEAFRIKLSSMMNEYKTSENSVIAETKHVTDQLIETEKEIKGYEWLYLKTIEGDSENEAEPDVFFTLQYENYVSKRAELYASIQSSKRIYEMNVLLEGDAVSSYEVEESKKTYDNAMLAYENQKTVFLLDIETRRRSLDEEKKNLCKSLEDLEIKMDQLGISGTSKYRYAAVEKTVKDELSSAMQLIETKEKNLKDLKTGLQETEEAIRECTVAAPANGTIHEVKTPVEGDYFAAGTVVLTVLPENEEEYKAIVYLNNSDRGNVETGMEIKLNIASFPSSEYGYFTGKLTDVAKDITVDQTTGRAFYRAEAAINIETAMDREGNRLPLESGMACEVKIITGEKTIMRWVLEKLSLLVKEKP